MDPRTRRLIAQHLTAALFVLLFLILMGLIGATETGY